MAAFGTSDGHVRVCATADMGSVHTVPAGAGGFDGPPSGVRMPNKERVAWSLKGRVSVADRVTAQTTVYVPPKATDGKAPDILSMAGFCGGECLVWGASDGCVCTCLVDMDMLVRPCTPKLDSAAVHVAASSDDALLAGVGAVWRVANLQHRHRRHAERPCTAGGSGRGGADGDDRRVRARQLRVHCRVHGRVFARVGHRLPGN